MLVIILFIFLVFLIPIWTPPRQPSKGKTHYAPAGGVGLYGGPLRSRLLTTVYMIATQAGRPFRPSTAVQAPPIPGAARGQRSQKKKSHVAMTPMPKRKGCDNGLPSFLRGPVVFASPFFTASAVSIGAAASCLRYGVWSSPFPLRYMRGRPNAYATEKNCSASYPQKSLS